MPTYTKLESGSWRVQLCVDGVRDSATRDLKADAVSWAQKRSIEIRASNGSTEAQSHYCMDDAITRYLRDVAPKHRGFEWERKRLNAMRPALQFGGERMNRLTADHFGKWRDIRLTQVSKATVLREFALLSGIFEVARKEWGWVSVNVIHDVKKPARPRGRSQVFSAQEVETMLMALGYERGTVPTDARGYVALAFLIALETAMRSGEIVNLLRENIDLDTSTVNLPLTKNGDARAVPLSTRAKALIELSQKVPMRESGKLLPLDDATRDAVWREARDRCGLRHLRFHDSRATALTRMARMKLPNGERMDVMTLAKISGHRDLKQLLNTYYRITATEIAAMLG